MESLSIITKQRKEEEEEEEEEIREPVSPIGLYLNSSVLSVAILCNLEFQTPITDDSMSLSLPLLRDVLLPINSRFSSIMVTDENGVKQWKKVEVKFEDHMHVPIFPSGLPPKSYDEYLDNYLRKISMEQLPECRPLWEVHVNKYPTSNAAGNVIFKLHHALGDGYSLIGALLSCLQKANDIDPTLPLTLPQFRRQPSQPPKKDTNMLEIFKKVPRVFSMVFNTMSDFGYSVLRSSVVEDDCSPIRSGKVGVEFSPMTISTISFSLDHIKQIKTKLGVTVNDVITGVIFLGIRLYMQAMNHGSSNLQSTGLVLLNTREINGYKSVEEMKKPSEAKTPIWGNQFCFLHIPIPELSSRVEDLNPVEFIMITHKLIQRKKNSLAVYLNGWFLEVLRKLKGPEVTSKYVHSTMKNASLCITNLIGPVEQMALAKHVIKSFYFMPVGAPQSLVISVVSYMGELRVAVGTEKDYIDSQKFKSCLQNAFNMMYKATCNTPLNANSKV